MNTLVENTIEMRRLDEQVRLDKLKTAVERNKWGQFATPLELAVSLATHARSLMSKSEGVRFLDPAIGTGSFFSAVREVYEADDIKAAIGVELDPLFAKAARELWSDSGLKVLESDFTRTPAPAKRFNLVLTNPPYVRHHHISASDKEHLKEQLAGTLQLTISGLAGLYSYVLLHCHDWMEDGGLAVWLIPSEFMDVNYGSTLRRYLSE